MNNGGCFSITSPRNHYALLHIKGTSESKKFDPTGRNFISVLLSNRNVDNTQLISSPGEKESAATETDNLVSVTRGTRLGNLTPKDGEVGGGKLRILRRKSISNKSFAQKSDHRTVTVVAFCGGVIEREEGRRGAAGPVTTTAVDTVLGRLILEILFLQHVNLNNKWKGGHCVGSEWLS